MGPSGQVFNVNSMGLSTLLWGTPKDRQILSDIGPSVLGSPITTDCVQFAKYHFIQLSTVPVLPSFFSTLCRRML